MTQTNLTPCFSSHYSYGQSLLTVEDAGQSSSDGPNSIVDIAIENSLKDIMLVDDRIDGFIESYKNFNKNGIKLLYGVKLIVCADHNDKSEASLDTESKIIIFAKNTQGYHDLIKIYNRAWTENFYYLGRTSWKQLNELWTDNLILALPFFSSFIAKNIINFHSNITPQFPCKPFLFREINSGLFTEKLINDGLKKLNYPEEQFINIKTIYYKNYSDFESYITFRAINKRTSFESPNIENLSSNNFCWEDYKKISI